MTMETYVFRLRLPDTVTDEDADKLHLGIDEEISVETGPRGHWVGFERQASSFLDAALEAITEVIELGFEPLALEDELVSISDIAERTGRTRQSISQLVEGSRGSGNFPPPVAGNVRSPLWHWADIADWFDSASSEAGHFCHRLRTIAALNGALAERVLSRERPDDLRRIRERLAG